MIKAVWYHALRGSFAAEFALDTELQTVRTLDQNFMQIKTLLGANTVLVRLMDQDAWCGQFGGGFSYNPAADPPQVLIDYKDGTPPFPVQTRPDFMIRRSVAEEIILSIAHKYELDVVFVIELSDYHVNTNDLDKYENEVGAYNYIQQYFDPTLYYGQQTTTQLPAVGLENSTTRSYLNDTRIVGWLLEPEWDPNALTGDAISGHQLEVFRRYWGHFHNLVHYRDPGANERGHFAGIYLISPDGQDRSQLGTLIRSYKTLMFEQGALPDVFGLGWYGNGNYDPSQIGPDIEFMVNEMGKPEPVAVSPNRIALLEGGCNQISNPARLSFYRDAIQTADQLGLKGVAVWEADGYSNLGPNQSGGNTDPNPGFSLFITTFAPTGNASFPTPGWSYQNRIYDNFPKYNGLPLSLEITPNFGDTFFSTQWGELAYQSLTTIGEVVRDAFMAAGGSLLYAAASAQTTLVQNTYDDIRGATVTLSKVGDWEITGVFDFNPVAGDGLIEGCLNVSGAVQAGVATVSGSTRATYSQKWKYHASSTSVTAKLQARKSLNGGSSTCEATNTTITAVFVG